MQRHARVFVSEKHGRVLIVSMHYNEDGILFEDEKPLRLSSEIAAETLGLAIRDALFRTCRVVRDLRNTRLTDWPAYRISSCRSVRQFEQEFIHISVRGENDANLVYLISGLPYKRSELEVTSSISSACCAQELGERTLEVYRACRDWPF